MRARLRGARLTELHATWRSRKHRKTGVYPSSSNSMWRVELKYAHARGQAIRTKAALSFGQRSINLPDNRRLLSILLIATTPMLTISQREAHKRNSLCVCARVCACHVLRLFVCFIYFIVSAVSSVVYPTSTDHEPRYLATAINL